jgi:hypothetical protein
MLGDAVFRRYPRGAGIGLTHKQCGESGSVKGCGRRPSANGAVRTGAGAGKSPGNEPAGMGCRGWGVLYGDSADADDLPE